MACGTLLNLLLRLIYFSPEFVFSAKMSTDVELRQPAAAGNFQNADEDESKCKSKCKCNCKCFWAVVACGMIMYEIYDIVSDSITTHEYGQGKDSTNLLY